MLGLLTSINYQTISMLAIVCGLVVLCLGMWYLWTTQQQMQTDMQFMQMQCTQLAAAAPAQKCPVNQPQLNAAETTATIVAPTNENALDSVLHRSVALMQAANDAQQDNAEENEDDEDDEDDDESCSDDYDDDDTAISQTSDAPQQALDHAIAAATSEAVGDDANLVESLLSNIVTETIDAQMQPNAPATSDASVEDFQANQGDPSKLTAALQQKTVNELKKMCAEYEIVVKKGKGYKRKDELIDDLVKAGASQ